MMENLDAHKQSLLFDLIEHGTLESALELLKGDNRISEDELNKSLISACHHRYKVIVQALVQLGASVNYRDTKGNSPLLISVQNGATDIVQFLLTNKADVNASNDVGDSALILSIRSSESTEITKKILKQTDINIEHQNQDGYTAIMIAAEMKDVGRLKILLENYINVYHTTTAPLYVPIDEHKSFEYTSKNVGDYDSQWAFLGKTLNCKGESVYEIAEKCGIGSVFKLLQQHVSTKISPLELAMRANDIKSFSTFLDCDFLYTSEKMLSLDEVFLYIFQTRSDKDIHFNENEIAMIKALLEHRKDGNKTVLDRKQTGRLSTKSALLEKTLFSKRHIDPVLIVARSGCVQVLQLLLSFKADVNMYDFPNSPLHIALSHGHTECAKLLIQHGANMDFKQALKFAIGQTDPTYVNFLIANYEKVIRYLKRTSEIDYVFLRSVRKSNLEIISRILDLGANINETVDSGKNPLAESKNGEVAKFLIDRGANVNHITKMGAISSTPIITVLYGRKIDDSSVVEVIQVLLENGAFANDRRWCGKTALMLAATKEGSMSVLQLLLDHGAELSERDSEGNSALIHATKNGCSQNVSLLLQFMQDRKQLLNVQTTCGFTALMYAMMLRNKPIIGQLIDQGADVNIKDSNGNTALHFLLRSDKHEDEILRSLIQAGCDVNCQNDEGISPLMLAAKYCLKDTISVLIESGAEINAVSKKDNIKTTLTHLLNKSYRENDQLSCMEYLLNRGASSSYVETAEFHKMIVAGHIQVIPKLIKCGFGPASITPYRIWSLRPAKYIMSSCSPLFTALWVGDSTLAHFFVGNLFLTDSDLSLLCHNKSMKHHLERMDFKECLDILDEISTQPMTLLNLSLVAVSTAVGTAPCREIKVNKLPLPQIIKEKLLFKSQDVVLTVPEMYRITHSWRMQRIAIVSQRISTRSFYNILNDNSESKHYSRHPGFGDYEDDYRYFADSD